jgi:hypothetical protein
MTGYTSIIYVGQKSGMQISAILVPGGVMLITECDVETSGNGISTSVSTTLIPMTDDTREQYLDAIAQEQAL